MDLAFIDDPEIDGPFPPEAQTPPREHSPGRLGEVPTEGPASEWMVEHRLYPEFGLVEMSWLEWKEAYVWVVQDDERVIDQLDLLEALGGERGI